MSSIGSIGSSYNSSMMQGTRQRPDTTKMAEQLFSQLDTSGQGFIQKSDLQAAFDKISSNSSSSSSTASASSTVDELFSTLDTDSSGKVSKQEFTETLAKLQNELDVQYQGARMEKAMKAGGTEGMGSRPPPPPPPPGDGPSMTKDDLTSALSQISVSDNRSNMMSNILSNFDSADTNSDGTVSFQEAMAYQQASGSSSNSSSTGSTNASASAASSSSPTNSSEAKVMMQIMKLMQAYNIGDDQKQNGNLLSSLSVSV